MDEDEDEDVVFEGSELHKHLVGAGYTGPEIEFVEGYRVSNRIDSEETVEAPKPILGSFISSLWCSVKAYFTQGDNDLQILFSRRLVEAIITCHLLSVEDCDFLLNLTEGEPEECEWETDWSPHSTVSTLGGLALSASLLISPRIPWLLHLPSLLYTGLNSLRYIKLKHREKKQVEVTKAVGNFVASLNRLHGLLTTISRSVQFIQEMELIDRGFTFPNMATHLNSKITSTGESCLLCVPLRQQILSTSSSVLIAARNLTIHLRASVPLTGVADHTSQYLADIVGDSHALRSQVGDTVEAVPTLRSIRASVCSSHQQLSEALRRLALALLSPKPAIDYLIYCLNEHVIDQVSCLTNRTQAAYDYYRSWNVRRETGAAVVKNTLKDDRERDCMLAVLHGLQQQLIATGLLVDQIFMEDSQTELSNRMAELKQRGKAISTCLQLVDWQVQKSQAPRQEAEDCPEGDGLRKVEAVLQDRARLDCEAVPLFGDWPLDVVDEILEFDARLADPATSRDHLQGQDDEWRGLEEQIGGVRMREASKRLYCELQEVLKSKAQEWREREAKVRQRTGIGPLDCEDLDHVQHPNLQNDQDSHSEAPMVVGRRARFDTTAANTVCHPPAPESLAGRSALLAQVQLLASQRPLQQEEFFAGSDSDEDS